jgi:putative hemolysin
MKLLDRKILSNAAGLHGLGGEMVSRFLMEVMQLKKINKLYALSEETEGMEFITTVINSLELKYEISEDDLKRIPASGAFITISNNPYGGIDGLLLIKIISEIRPDYKILANFLLRRFEHIKDYFLPVNPFENSKEIRDDIKDMKLAYDHLLNGAPLGFFPAGEVSTYQSDYRIRDRKWDNGAVKFLRKAEVPIIPVYFQGSNSRLYHILGKIHPVLRTAKLASEMFNKKNKIIRIRIGNPISVKEQKKFEYIDQFGRYLRARTYALGTSFGGVTKFFKQVKTQRIEKIQDIIPPVSRELIEKEINSVLENYLLFQSQDFKVLCAPSDLMPNVLTEIGRLREVTFRDVGEGTNMSVDLDEYDIYYNQLIIWDDKEKRIVGAYRVGKGKDIIAQYGKKGFYLNSLFRIKSAFVPYLQQSFELGRSFIVKEYQRKPLSLFLLWKGILYLLLKNSDYRYLIGPVSISNEFSKFSKTLIVEFCKKHLFNHELGKFIRPRKKFRVKKDRNVDREIFLSTTKDLDNIDKIIQDIEPNLRTPVLLKKYIKLNAKLIGFNIDPKFNNCLDGFIILDIYDVPQDIIKSLSKELDDESILDRFNSKLEEVPSKLNQNRIFEEFSSLK